MRKSLTNPNGLARELRDSKLRKSDSDQTFNAPKQKRLKGGQKVTIVDASEYPTHDIEGMTGRIDKGEFGNILVDDDGSVSVSLRNGFSYWFKQSQFRVEEANVAKTYYFKSNDEYPWGSQMDLDSHWSNWCVLYITRGQQADNLGVQVGDVLVAVNNLRIDNFNWKDIKESLYQNEGNACALTFERGVLSAAGLAPSLFPVANKLNQTLQLHKYEDLQNKGIVESNNVSSRIHGNMRKLEKAFRRDQINALLYQRPDREELIMKGIIPSGKRSSLVEHNVKALQHNMRMDQMNALLYDRPEKKDLVAKGILPPGTQSSGIERAKKELEHRMRIDQMNALYYARPDKNELIQRGIVPSGRRSSVVERAKKELEHAMRIDQMNALLYSRPDRKQLIAQGIIPSGKEELLTRGILHTEREEKTASGGRDTQSQQKSIQSKSSQFHLACILLQRVSEMLQANKINLDERSRLKDLIIDQEKKYVCDGREI